MHLGTLGAGTNGLAANLLPMGLIVRLERFLILASLLVGPSAGMVGAASEPLSEDPVPANPNSPVDADVAIQELPPVQVLYLEHSGPYWGMGKLFRQAADAMIELDQAGPLFARYLDDPGSAELNLLRAQVGFFVAGEVSVPAGFSRASWPKRRAAVLRVPDHFGRFAAMHARVFSWVKRNGYSARGDVVEVYREAEANGHATDIQAVLMGSKGFGTPDRPASSSRSPEPEVEKSSRAEAGKIRMLKTVGLPQSQEPRTTGQERCANQLAVRIEAIRQMIAQNYPQHSLTMKVHADRLIGALSTSADIEARSEAGILTDDLLGVDYLAYTATLADLDAMLVNVTLKRGGMAKVLERMAELAEVLDVPAEATRVQEQ